MKNKIIIIMIVMIFLMLSLSGCNDESKKDDQNNNEPPDDTIPIDNETQEPDYKSNSERLRGTWKSVSEFNNSSTIVSYTFLPDFTFSTYYFFEEKNMTGYGTWFIYDQYVSLTLSVVNETAVYEFAFLNNDTILSLTDSQDNIIRLNKKGT